VIALKALGTGHQTSEHCMSILTAHARVRVLGTADLDGFLALNRTVMADGLPGGFLQAKSDAMIATYLDGTAGRAYGIFEQEQLTAAALMRIPRRGRANAGKGFPRLSHSDWAYHTAFMEHAVVAPAARGRGLHRALLEARLSDASLSGMDWVASGTHLRNSSSWFGLLAGGMTLVGARIDPHGHEVLALLTSLTGATFVTDPSDRRSIARDHTAAHFHAIQEGYLGIGIDQKDRVIYARALT
jgi:GNAT superfamily N-acetyltransferase